MKVLLAMDDSKSSQEALRTVLSQVRPRGTEVRVLHVIEPIHLYISAGMMPHYVPQVAKVEEERRKQANVVVERAARLLRQAGFKTSEQVDTGNPKAKIIDHAAKWDADLIVVGSHGWKGLNRFLMGSVSEAVMRHARCSVQVVRIRRGKKRGRAGGKR